MKKNVLIITGSRADFGLLESTIKYLVISKKLESKVLATGMHTLESYGKTVNDISLRGIHVDFVVSVSEDGNMLKWLCEEIEGISVYCSENKIDCIVVLGDRDEALAGAIVAGHLGIPLAHIHGGDVTGAGTVDHQIRNAITQFASYNFTATKKSAERVMKMREKKHIYVVGAPGMDLVKDIPFSSKEKLAQKLSLLEDLPWIVILLHPVYLDKNWSVEMQITNVFNAVNTIKAEKIWIFPNSDTGSEKFIQQLEKYRFSKIHFFSNLRRDDFINLLKQAKVLIGNSSAGIIESTFFNLPVVNIGDRQKGREKSSNVIQTDYNVPNIVNAIKIASSDKFSNKCKKIKKIYGDGSAGKKIVKMLEKYL